MQVLNEQEVAQNVQKIAQDVREAALQAGRDPSEVQVMAVTKTVDPVLVNAAIGAGITLLGENKAQELCAKYDSYHKDGVQIHFIGHLQTNKVRQIVDKVSMVESVDSIKLAREIDRHCAAIGKVMDVLLEVNIGREENKTGVFPELLPALLEEAGKLEHIRVRGLMTIPPADAERDANFRYFQEVQALYVDMNKKLFHNELEYLSMGMSGDYEDAIRAGATMVRVGSAIFGARHYN